jgi:putative ATPase
MAGTTLLRELPVRRTVLFVDEIHRFNRVQQDAFLPYVERGDLVLIGATTENPSFHINAALMSRCRLVVLRSLDLAELEVVVRRALADRERGLGRLGVQIHSDALQMLVQLASGDARRVLNLLELVANDVAGSSERLIEEQHVTRVAQRKVLLYDRNGDGHFDLISALHKSLRESDPDASLYWLSRMLTAGEEPLYIARRLLRFAAEDVGLADPQALPQAVAAWEAFNRLGSPEGELALAQCAVYLALAPKSNSVYEALGRARRAVEERPAEGVPMALRNAPTRLMREIGYGKGYVYAHDTEEGVGGLDCLPEALQGSQFYLPRDRGYERQLTRRLQRFRALREQARARLGERSPKRSGSHQKNK